jgi:hypothetical protein
MRLMTSLPSLSQLFRQVWILNILQAYRLPWPIMGIALIFTFYHDTVVLFIKLGLNIHEELK